MQTLKQSSTAKPLVFAMWDSTDPTTPKTGLTCTVTLSKNGGSFASPSGAVTEIGNGLYKVAGNATDTNTLGILALYATATGAKATLMAYNVVAYDQDDAAGLGLSRVDAAVTTRLASGSYTAPDNTSITAIKAKTDNLPASPAAVSDIPSASSIATAVWGSASRTLTSFGTLVSDIWSNATRTLSGFGTLVTDIWAAGSRTLTSGAAPSAASIADAVCDELLSGHMTPGSVGSALSAASAAGDPWATVVPGAYGAGTAGAAFGRLNIGQPDEPVIVLPDPPAAASLCRVVGYFETVDGRPAAGAIVYFELLSTDPMKAGSWIVVERVIEAVIDKQGRVADKDGNPYIDIQRTNQMTPNTKQYRITCPAAKFSWTGAVTTTTLDLATKIT